MENVQMNAGSVTSKTTARRTKKVGALAAKVKPLIAKSPKAKKRVAAPKVAAVKVTAPKAAVAEKAVSRRNLDRFMEATGGTEQEYYQWAKGVGRRMHINKLDALVCAQLGVYAIGHATWRPTQVPEGMSEGEAAEHLLVHSVNAFELAMMWKKARADAQTWVSKESILNEWLTGMRKEDFERWGDKNHAEGVSKRWWNKEAAALDVALLEMNAMELLGAEITTQDAIDFVTANKPGAWENPAQERVQVIEERFKSVTTFRIKDYYVEHLIRSCSSPDAVDVDDLPF